jgi:hypothetical protein
MMMQRDERLTGHKRGQKVRAIHSHGLDLNAQPLLVRPCGSTRVRDKQYMVHGANYIERNTPFASRLPGFVEPNTLIVCSQAQIF